MILSYARVSTAEQAADGSTSIAEQQRKNRAIAQMRGASSFDIAEYVDPGISGAIAFAERPAGAEILKQAKAGDVIVAAKLDRMFRSLLDSLNTIDHLRSAGVGLILPEFGTEPIEESATAKLFFSLLGTFAEFERGRTSERTSDGRRVKRLAGGHLGGSPPYGYKVAGEGRQAKLEAIPEEQMVLDQIKTLMQQHTPASACREAMRLGLKDRAGSPFRIVQLQRIAARKIEIAA